MEHSFTLIIRQILEKYFSDKADDVFQHSLLIQYLNEKTRSANKGSKARSSFANLFAVYVLVEDYLNKGFPGERDYSTYEGVEFIHLFTRQRKLPFGEKLQNHALNNRLNSEFQKFFPNSDFVPVIRNLETNKYWFNENLLLVKIGGVVFYLAISVVEIIDEYINSKKKAFEKFVDTCAQLQSISSESSEVAIEFISGLISSNVDARLFEIVSYSILKYYYHDQVIFWGFEKDNLKVENLKLFKTGRANANDGGIDFVMQPLGRFFQVTETLDFKKYFLDIDKVQRYPITFVVKSDDSIESLMTKIEKNALKSYNVISVVAKYMSCIEELINLPVLKDRFAETIDRGYLNQILNEIALQSKVEFNYQELND